MTGAAGAEDPGSSPGRGHGGPRAGEELGVQRGWGFAK